ncbi:TetR/AcrR family transcriptional regulator [Nocardia sp. NPDC057440]|uniref:TetR/AcrR family transcriptional regulator n=1 Tax=Nocardia sp. NPDC057440 TaxID=3346134 RepID=UPI0036702F0E
MGVAGAAGISMRSVCREAALTERYFYESFANIDQLMITVLEIVVLDARAALLSVPATSQTFTPDLVRQGVDAFTDYLTTDPRRGRIMFIESQVSPLLATRAIALVEQFVVPIVRSVGAGNVAATELDAVDVSLNAVAIFGALAFLYRRALTEGPQVDRERFAEHAAQVIEPIALARSSRSGSGAARDR